MANSSSRRPDGDVAPREARRILSFVRGHDRFLVTGHAHSDGDALGSALAFHLLLRKMGKRSHVVCDRGVLPDYRFLPGSAGVGSGPGDLRPDYTAVFTFDSGAWSRLERIAEKLPRERLFVVNVDHHESNERFGDLNWIDPSFSCCGEMVWELAKAAGREADRRIAVCVYTALVTDTGSFSFSNTTVRTHRTAAELLSFGADPSEVHDHLNRQKTPKQLRFTAECLGRIRLADGGRVAWLAIPWKLVRKTGYEPVESQEYVNLVRSIRGVRAAVLLRETGEPGRIKVSWRTDAGIDGIALARKWGGGGHPRASGATFPGRLAEAEREVIAETVRLVRRASR